MAIAAAEAARAKTVDDSAYNLRVQLALLAIAGACTWTAGGAAPCLVGGVIVFSSHQSTVDDARAAYNAAVQTINTTYAAEKQSLSEASVAARAARLLAYAMARRARCVCLQAQGLPADPEDCFAMPEP